MADVHQPDPGELLASIPYLLGYYPTDSLVVVGLTGPQNKNFAATLRTELPPPRARHHAGLAGQMLNDLRQLDVTAAVVALIGGEPVIPEALPRPVLVRTLDVVLGLGGVPVIQRLWAPVIAQGAPWRSYDDPAHGDALPSPDQTPTAATANAAGLVTYASRSDLVALVTPDAPQALARRAELIATMTPSACPHDTTLADANALRHLSFVHAAVTLTRRGHLVPGDELIARLAVALTDHGVRDSWIMPPSNRQAAAAEQLWQTLTRATPAPHRAEPAVLLALAAYLRGDGALAAIALDAAEAANPAHELTALVRTALSFGIPPQRLAQMLARARQGASHDQP